jgi:hypothetical protein
MPYEVLGDSAVSVLRANGEYRDEHEHLTGYDHESIVYLPGDIIADVDVSPVVVKNYEDGDEHTRSVLQRVSNEPLETHKRETVKRAKEKGQS